MRKVIGIGETILDIVFQGNQPVKAVPGGSTFNCMVSLGRLHIPSFFISELGKDRVGEFIRSFMEENHLPTDYIYVFPQGKSPVSLAFLSEHKDAEYLFYKEFPERRLEGAFPEIQKNDLVVLSSYFAVDPILRNQVSDLLGRAKEKNALIYYDINFRKPHAAERETLMDNVMDNFRLASIIRCSEEDLEILFPGQTIQDAYQHYVAPYRKMMIITRGGKGILLKTPSLEKEYEVESIVPVSTIGAGDNFNAGMIYGFISGHIGLKDLNLLQEEQWDSLIRMAERFATDVCGSYDNYISEEFAEAILSAKNH